MDLQTTTPLHLTYCLNIHPGETWAENLEAIRDRAAVVRDKLGCKGRFGLGLRLSRTAAEQLNEPRTLAAFREFLTANRLYAFTINGFPYGTFHGQSIKQDVYAPDWRTPERRDYTILLANILAALLPPDVKGSISTVPCSYKSWIRTEEHVHEMAGMLVEVAAHLADLERDTGRTITLGLEPEPDCFLETTDELIAFFSGPLHRHGVEHVRRRTGCTAAAAEAAIRNHLGVCVDTAHAAVQYETLADSLRRLQRAGILVSKIQLSAALRLQPTATARARLREFCDAVYLHQVKTRGCDGARAAYPDLPEALDAGEDETGADHEWRVHFHVPLFLATYGELSSTADELDANVRDCILAGVTEHLEIETYTFGVLPDALRTPDITDSIVREYQWVLNNFLRSPTD